jgi:DNA replication protein DnaC
VLLTQTLEKLDALGLFGMALGLREQLEQSQYTGLSFDERFGLLVDREAEARDSRRLALRLKAAKLRQEATVEDLDFRTPRGLDKAVVLSLAQAGWVANHHNVLISGPTGAGKSFLACALTHAAVRRGHTALYIRTPRLLAELALKLLGRLPSTRLPSSSAVCRRVGSWLAASAAHLGDRLPMPRMRSPLPRSAAL